MRRSIILDTTVRVVFDGVIVLSIYMLFAGHNQPGGGFIGGLLAGAGIALRYVADGMRSVRTILPFSAWTVMAAGLVLAASDALMPVLLGDPPLDSVKWSFDMPVLGHIGFTSATFFDTGVYLVVVGLILMILEALGEEDSGLVPADADDAGDEEPPS